MATVGERLALAEERIDQMWEWINGGPTRRYEDSARGILHQIVQTMSTEALLKEALEEAKRQREQQTGRQWSRLDRLLARACGLAVAVAAVYALVH